MEQELGRGIAILTGEVPQLTETGVEVVCHFSTAFCKQLLHVLHGSFSVAIGLRVVWGAEDILHGVFFTKLPELCSELGPTVHSDRLRHDANIPKAGQHLVDDSLGVESCKFIHPGKA